MLAGERCSAVFDPLDRAGRVAQAPAVDAYAIVNHFSISTEGTWGRADAVLHTSRRPVFKPQTPVAMVGRCIVRVAPGIDFANIGAAIGATCNLSVQ